MKIKKYLFYTVFSVGIFGCDSGFEKVNTNPNSPTTVPSNLLIPDIIRVAMNTSYSTFNGGDMGSCWAQHWSKVQYNDEERYSPRESQIEFVWDTYYADVISGAKSMEVIATAEGNDYTRGIALTMQAYGFGVLTDLYGDIPFSNALKAEAGNTAPSYDTQEDVYDGILAMLDDADEAFDGEGSIDAVFDIMYAGDVSKWQKFANSLKFRCLMRISGVRDVSSDLAALVSRPMFTSNDDEAKLVYLETQPNANPIYETIVFGNRNEFKVSDILVNTLDGLGDPRLEVYAQLNDADEYVGKPAGIADVPSDAWNYNNVSAVGEAYLAPNAPAYLLSYSELQFLMAEAAENDLITGDAETFYNAGIAASMEANGIADFAAYMSNPEVIYSSGTSDLQIGTQKWLALFCQGFEAWTEWRRTNFPVLIPAQDPINITEIPSRYRYPATEQTTNKVNYTAAVASQGPNNLTTKIWWMD